MTYGYDALNRLSSVTDASGVTTYSYDAVGNLSGYTYPNGIAGCPRLWPSSSVPPGAPGFRPVAHAFSGSD
jgi:YD repeat-containing protein